MRRRKFIVGVGIAFSLPGCLNERSPSETSDNNHDPTEDSDERDDNTDSQTDGNNSYTYDESRQDPIFIENTKEEEVIVKLSVEQKSDGETLVENVYSIPPKTGIEIPNIAKVENEYIVTAEYDENVDTFDWSVLTCAHEDGSEIGGETSLGVEIADDDLHIYHTDCDMVGAGDNQNLTYENHKEYMKEE
ncbi:hypothetical protein [Halopiger aswanensis]|uniref:Uncharacterized protein n=1 Tax=Halopiger aswanensis TaxID=148449 RepID=A0A419VZV3_9EURY|nr:hypothetical protein [Halopiger aswanensis]RKD88550.1 hypothetical protein ATJ93_4204 [Halopiger aswanensis]